jgi:solute carrier family 25 protein 39/40
MALNGNGITPTQQMVASGAGALLVSLFMTPLDVVKIRLQAQELLFEKKCFIYSNGIMDHLYARVNGDPKPVMHTTEEICNCRWYNRPKYFSGTLDAMVKISRTEGVTSLWSGLSPTLVLAVPTTVIYFTSYELLRKKMFDAGVLAGSDHQQTLLPLAAGGLARVWAVTVVSPLELVRTKMQSQKMALSQIREGLRNTVRSYGILGLWKGYSATLYRDVPFSAIYWPFYEAFRNALVSDEHLFGSSFVAGILAGSIASTVTLPMDVIKTRRQIQWGETFLFNGKNGGQQQQQQRAKAPTTLTLAREIVAAQGMKGLFTGLTPRILKVAPACAIMISSYEHCKQLFRERNQAEAAVIRDTV